MKPHILLVDDGSFQSFSLMSELKKRGFQHIDYAVSEKSAQEYLNEGKFDLIITCATLQGTRAFDLAQTVALIQPGKIIPILQLTSGRKNPKLLPLPSPGFQRLSRPIDFNFLEKTIKQFFSNN